MSSELAQRVAGQRDPAQRGQMDLRQQVQGMGQQFQMAMPKGMEASQLVRDALTCLSATPKLAECDATSVLGGLMTCAQLGLRPAVLGHAWLLPMWDRKTGGQKATLVIGYQGYLELAYRSNKVSKVTARIIRDGDKYTIRYGDNETLQHTPNLFGEQGAPIAYYATAQLIPKATTFQVMSKREVEEHRDKFAMAKTKTGVILGPWKDHFDAMALKTVVLRLIKTLPKSPELTAALAADGGVRVDLTASQDVNTVVDVTQTIETVDAEIVAEGEEIPWAAAEAQAQQAAADAGYTAQ